MEESQKPLGKPVHKGLIATIGAGVIWLGGELVAKEAGWLGDELA